MRKKCVSLLLALVMCLSLLPGAASAAETELPDWYFLFAIFKNVDADVKGGNGKTQHATYSMTREEVDTYHGIAGDFERYLTETGVMRAHVDVVEIDTAVTELKNDDSNGSYLWTEQAAPLLKAAQVDLDRYDHVACLTSLNVGTSYVGLGGGSYENGTGHACINTKNWKFCQEHFVPGSTLWTLQVFVHEYLHFMEPLSKKFSPGFSLHGTQAIYNSSHADNWKGCYTDIILNRARGNTETGTGVHPVAWQYPPRVLRTMTELNIPSGTTRIGDRAFANNTALKKVTLPGSVGEIGPYAFYKCTGLTELSILPGVTSIGEWAFGCRETRGALARVSIPASVTRIDYAAFWNSNIKDVYYSGTEAQWKAIRIGDYNGALTNANIHCNHLMADVKTTDTFAPSIAWALENGITGGTGGGRFSPNSPCTRAMAVTYLWKLAGSPAAKAAAFTDVPAGADCAGAVSWAVEQGVTAGTGGSAFSPDRACTRGQIVTFLHRALAG